MSYRIYTTPGFVLSSRPQGEGGKILFIFTAELGQIAAFAQGIRLSKSKLRYHAQDYSLANFSLVRGKDFWRVVGVESVYENSIRGSASKNAYLLQVRILSVLSRLLQGEEKNAELFDAVYAAYQFLGTPHVEDFTKSAELIIMLRILHHLGYVRLIPEIAPFLKDNSFAPDIFEAFTVSGVKTITLKEINTALQESQL